MASVTLTSPDGKTYTLTPPEGASPEQIQGVVDDVVKQLGGGG